MKEIKKLSKISILTAFLPVMVFATETFNSLLIRVSNFFKVLIPVLLILATIIFIWGIISYIIAAGDAGKQKEARGMILWGVILLFAIVAVWGLVSVLEETTGVKNTTIPTGPLPV